MGVSLAVYLLILPWHSVAKLRWDFSGMLCLWSCDSFLELGLLILWSCDALKVWIRRIMMELKDDTTESSPWYGIDSFWMETYCILVFCHLVMFLLFWFFFSCYASCTLLLTDFGEFELMNLSGKKIIRNSPKITLSTYIKNDPEYFKLILVDFYLIGRQIF